MYPASARSTIVNGAACRAMHADAVQVAKPRPVKGARWRFDTALGISRTALRRRDRVKQRPLWVGSDPSGPRGAVVQFRPDYVWRRPYRLVRQLPPCSRAMSAVPRQRALVTRVGARQSDCNVSQTVCSSADGQRQETLQPRLQTVPWANRTYQNRRCAKRLGLKQSPVRKISPSRTRFTFPKGVGRGRRGLCELG